MEKDQKKVVGNKPTTSSSKEQNKIEGIPSKPITKGDDNPVSGMKANLVEQKDEIVVEKEVLSKELDKLYSTATVQKTKKVIIKASPTFIVTPPEVMNEAWVVIGCPNKNRSIYIPLERDELEQVAATMFGFSTKHSDFTKEIMDYFQSYRIKVEYGNEKMDGVKLTLPIDDDGNVIWNPEYADDIIKYRICKQSPRVAVTPDEVLIATSGQSDFIAYIYDAEADLLIQRQLNKVKREAEKNFLVYTEDSKQKELKWITRIISKGVPIGNGQVFMPELIRMGMVDLMNPEDMALVLRDVKDKYPAALNQLVQDPNLELRATVELAIDLGIVTRSSDGMIKFRETVLGTNSNEAIDALKSPRYQNLLVDIKAALATVQV